MIANIGQGLFWGVWGGLLTYTLIERPPLKQIFTEKALYHSNVASGIAGCTAFLGHRIGGGGHHAIAWTGIAAVTAGIFNICNILAEQNKEIQQLKKNQQISASGE